MTTGKQLLYDFSKLLHHYFPKLKEDITFLVRDTRRVASCHYTVSELVLGVVMMYMTYQGSRHQMNINREYEEFRRNYAELLGLRLPHMDTCNALLCTVDTGDMELLLRRLVRVLLHKRIFHKFRLLGTYFTVAIDGTGIYSYNEEPYPGCPYKTSKNGKKTYHQSVVEAKLVCSNGFSISLASEWIINEDGSTKQDCEYKATMRLLDKLHALYPRLPLCLLMDGLFVKYPIQAKIKSFGWEFIMVWKDKTLYKLQDQVEQRRMARELSELDYYTCTNSTSREEYLLEYDTHSLDHKDIAIWYLKGVKTEISTHAQIEDKTTTFVFMSSIALDQSQVKAIFEAGRMRWKIENEGFNIQKNHGLNLHHKMNRKNHQAIRNYYICLQIAHLLSQLYTLSKNLAACSHTTVKDTWLRFGELLRTMTEYIAPSLTQRYNLRY